MSGRKMLGWGAVGAAGIGGYYLYSAGGSPKLAEKQMEHDAATAVRKMKGDLPGQDKEAKKAGEEGMEAIKARARELDAQVKAEAERAEKKLETYRQEANKKFEEVRKEGNQAVDKFDRNVEKAASETKSWFSGWFGGK